MIHGGNRGKEICMYLNRSSGEERLKFLMSRVIYLAPGLLSMLFQRSLAVLMSAVHVVSSPG